MTARATQRQPKKCRAGRCHHVVELVGALLGGQPDVGTFYDVDWAAYQETSSDIDPDSVSGNLFPHEPVIRFILVECGNNVVSKPPSVRAFAVGFKTIALCKANDIQPMTSPAFA